MIPAKISNTISVIDKLNFPLRDMRSRRGATVRSSAWYCGLISRATATASRLAHFHRSCCRRRQRQQLLQIPLRYRIAHHQRDQRERQKHGDQPSLVMRARAAAHKKHHQNQRHRAKRDRHHPQVQPQLPLGLILLPSAIRAIPQLPRAYRAAPCTSGIRACSYAIYTAKLLRSSPARL